MALKKTNKNRKSEPNLDLNINLLEAKDLFPKFNIKIGIGISLLLLVIFLV